MYFHISKCWLVEPCRESYKFQIHGLPNGLLLLIRSHIFCKGQNLFFMIKRQFYCNMYEKSGRLSSTYNTIPDSKVHGANKGPNWDLSTPYGPHVGPMNLAIWNGFQSERYCITLLLTGLWLPVLCLIVSHFTFGAVCIWRFSNHRR